MRKAVKCLGWFALAAMPFLSGPAFASCEAPGSTQETLDCLAQDLRDSDRRINAVYKHLMDSKDDAGKRALRDEQRTWLKARDKICSLDNKETDREKWLQAIMADQHKMVCVVRYTFERVAQLDAELVAKGDGSLSASLPSAPRPVTFGKPRKPSADGSSLQVFVKYPEISNDIFFALEGTVARDFSTNHENGRWYYEFLIDRDRIAELGDLLITPGFSSEKNGVIRIINIRRSQRGSGPILVGLALDLDDGYVYVRQNGEWRVPPGGANAVQMPLGQPYVIKFEASSDLRELMRQGMVKVNKGEQPFAEAMPDGYRPWGQQ